jgi:hypothetical protein
LVNKKNDNLQFLEKQVVKTTALLCQK